MTLARAVASHPLSRRMFLGGAIALPILGLSPARHVNAQSANWVEVTGFATAASAADRDAARRRAHADALLSAALAGGAQVKGHSAMSMTRMTSDLLIVRPIGQVLAHRILAQDFDGLTWRVRIAAQVGQPKVGQCTDRRKLLLSAFPPQIHVAATAPAWTDSWARELSLHLLTLAERHSAVARFTRMAGPSSDRTLTNEPTYLTLTRGSTSTPAGGHGLYLDLTLTPENRHLVLDLRMRLQGAGLDLVEDRYATRIRMPAPSPLGRVGVLVQNDRQALAADLKQQTLRAFSAFLDRAACQPPQAVLQLSQGKLTVPLGRVHGLTRASLAFTADQDKTTEMLEITELSDHLARLQPLDPSASFAHFQGRPIRFLEMVEKLP